MIRIVTAALALALAGPALAWKPLETTDEARQRHEAERWQTYERRGYEAPLGGYRDRLGDPAPAGTERPGYVEPRPTYAPQRRRFDRDPLGGN